MLFVDAVLLMIRIGKDDQREKQVKVDRVLGRKTVLLPSTEAVDINKSSVTANPAKLKTT
jgi:hypothetical protein